MKEMAAQGRPDTPQMRDAIRQELINREIVAQEAIKKGIHKRPEVSTQIDLQRQAVLINAYLQDYLKAHPVSDDAVKKEYERVKESAGSREYKVRHILVETEDEAKQVIAQVKKGASFEKLAGEKSKDQGSKGRGGDLDWATPARYVPAFGQAITKLKKGQMTEAPVQTQFGWHVIRVDDERPAKFPAFEEAKPQIEQQLRQQTVNKAFTDLRAKAKIE
jgi:peptidyl-prolyl cis-trans isomerase C